jgi:hypothetical protein
MQTNASKPTMTGARHDRLPLKAWSGAAALALAAFVPAFLGYRVLFADGAYVLYELLTNPHRFVAIELGRGVALHVMESPVLLGELLSVLGIGAMARLLHLGIFGVPLALFICALWLVRRELVLFALTVSAFAVFSFSINFIDTETNFYFAVCWLAATILALPGVCPILRGTVLPLVAVLSISNHEGAIFSAPALAIWATLRAQRSPAAVEITGLGMAAVFFWIAAVIALVAGLAPRDMHNASGFLADVPAILMSPHRWLLLTAALAPCALLLRGHNLRLACLALAVASGILYVRAISRVAGYYGYYFYYSNRAALALLMVVALGIFALASRSQPAAAVIEHRRAGYLVALIPLVFAVTGDLIGSYRWNSYLTTFCEVLTANDDPQTRLQKLEASGNLTGWRWTHPTLSVLLRPPDSSAFVVNAPGGWEPPDVHPDSRLDNRPGICMSSRVSP